MSYDVWLEIDTGGPERAEVACPGNYTSNCSVMWDYACKVVQPTASLPLCLRDMDEHPASECAPILARAVEHMADPANRETYLAMNPPNGWGKFETALAYLRSIAEACAKHPRAVVRVSR